MNTPAEENLLRALVELDNAIKVMPAIEAKPNLLLLFIRIDELAKELPPGTDPTLLHYLDRKSHEKARLLLQGRDADRQAGHSHHV
jgi:hypothetical protein